MRAAVQKGSLDPDVSDIAILKLPHPPSVGVSQDRYIYINFVYRAKIRPHLGDAEVLITSQ